jgi:hypothetical protein
MWKPDEILLNETKRVLESLLEAAAKGRTDVITGALEAFGTLVFLGRKEDAGQAVMKAGHEFKNSVLHALSDFQVEDLDRAAAEIALLAPDLAAIEQEDERTDIEERIVEALAIRDRHELTVEGARAVLGKEPELSDDIQAAALSFDETIEENLWRILPLGSRRAARSVWAAPEYRSRLWWWFRGSDLSETALDDLATAARVIHLFPEARKELERLVQVEGNIERIVRTDKLEAEVVSIFSHLKERYKSAFPYTYSEQLRIAASDQEDERLLLELEQVSFSMNRVNLIVDYENIDALPGKKVKHPVILIAPNHPDLPAKPTEKGRYELSLDAEQFGAEKAKLKVKLKKGAITVDLPFREKS